MQNPDQVVLGLGDFNGQVGKQIDGLLVCMVDMKLAKEMLREENY